MKSIFALLNLVFLVGVANCFSFPPAPDHPQYCWDSSTTTVAGCVDVQKQTVYLNSDGTALPQATLSVTGTTLLVVASFGGGLDDASKWSQSISTVQGRALMVDSLCTYVQQHNLSGVDFKWGYSSPVGDPTAAANQADLELKLKSNCPPTGAPSIYVGADALWGA